LYGRGISLWRCWGFDAAASIVEEVWVITAAAAMFSWREDDEEDGDGVGFCSAAGSIEGGLVMHSREKPQL
jgi:hypothetical protein